jgi:hypothetical protein
MPKCVTVLPHLTTSELEMRYRRAQEPHERSWWQILWLLSRGQTARHVAQSTGYSAYWIGQLAKRFNTEGPDGMRNRARLTSHRQEPLLSLEQQEELRQALAEAPPGGTADHALERAAGGGVDERAAGTPGRGPTCLGLSAAPGLLSSVSPSTPCAGGPSRTGSVQKKAETARQPLFRQHCGLGRGASPALSGATSPARSRPLHDAIPLVAKTPQEATITQEEAVSSGSV